MNGTWRELGSKVAIRAEMPGLFLEQHVAPLTVTETFEPGPISGAREIVSDNQFWRSLPKMLLERVVLKNFRITDWFPRVPGVFWSASAKKARGEVFGQEYLSDKDLGYYYNPVSKRALIEGGGIGTVRLLPRRVDNEDCWFATAVSGNECHAGIPLVVPDQLIKKRGIDWGDEVNLIGRVRLLSEAGLKKIAKQVRHAVPVIVFVDEMEGKSSGSQPVEIAPVALFAEFDDHPSTIYRKSTQYTFVSCQAGSDSELDFATNWVQTYATKFSGSVITNFDELSPMLADAPLSYQRLVDKTYNKAIVKSFYRSDQPVIVNQIETLVQKSVFTVEQLNIGTQYHVSGGNIGALGDNAQATDFTQTTHSKVSSDADVD